MFHNGERLSAQWSWIRGGGGEWLLLRGGRSDNLRRLLPPLLLPLLVLAPLELFTSNKTITTTPVAITITTGIIHYILTCSKTITTTPIAITSIGTTEIIN